MESGCQRWLIVGYIAPSDFATIEDVVADFWPAPPWDSSDGGLRSYHQSSGDGGKNHKEEKAVFMVTTGLEGMDMHFLMIHKYWERVLEYKEQL